jgi:hypothetical protein
LWLAADALPRLLTVVAVDIIDGLQTQNSFSLLRRKILGRMANNPMEKNCG